MPERIRAGIVGASPQSWAAAAHLPALAHLDELVPAWSTATAQDVSSAKTPRRAGLDTSHTSIVEYLAA